MAHRHAPVGIGQRIGRQAAGPQHRGRVGAVLAQQIGHRHQGADPHFARIRQRSAAAFGQGVDGRNCWISSRHGHGEAESSLMAFNEPGSYCPPMSIAAWPPVVVSRQTDCKRPRMKRPHALAWLFAAVATLCGATAFAQQVTGTLGSASATTTVPGNQLPPPDPKFGGVIKERASDSKAWWPPRVVPPKKAPNVLLIMTDDDGFGSPSTFGGVIPTPALDRIAKSGLRYTNFHSTSLCSPTRAAIITGRNHHSVGFGVVGEIATGFPGYDSIIPIEKGTIGTILKHNGYATSWFGKDHNTPFFANSQAGPFDQWPNGMGFEYFWGFVGGDASQWQPNLFRNTTPIFPFQGNPGWNMQTAMADEAIQYMKQLKALAPEKPFFVYYVPGATHAPHHPTPEWIKKVGDMKLFDAGWEKLRETIFANQKRLGIMPPNAQLTPWPDGQDIYGGAKLPRWDSLSWEEKKLFVKQADVYAAYQAYADHEIGRVSLLQPEANPRAKCHCPRATEPTV
jgi:arylsulfatase